MQTKRLLIIAAVALVWMLAVFGRLGYLQLFRHSEYMARAQRQQKRVMKSRRNAAPSTTATCTRWR